jgi:hypothetical protein
MRASSLKLIELARMAGSYWCRSRRFAAVDGSAADVTTATSVLKPAAVVLPP